MTSTHRLPSTNQLLKGLPREEKARFSDTSESVPLIFGEVLQYPNRTLEYVYFPTDGFISQMTVLDGESRLEIAMAGREGVLGVSALLGVDHSALMGIVQGAGEALRVEADSFRCLVANSPELHRRLLRYLYVVMHQLSGAAACIHFHHIEERLARWLLMTHDRAGSDHLRLTHEFLAIMLGVRRAGITLSAIALQTRKLIDYHRGEITILDRPGLIKAACSCYETDRALYASVMARAD
ncbi:Crp/Fnr family transcriptional regulator [Halomonas sp. HMF6819]|uniref:Crp/Fnr family transcriptional regulator n=1 Tax=Halomonas sp. HMF6819 TaxID=3373085 RepID=UPI003797A325